MLNRRQLALGLAGALAPGLALAQEPEAEALIGAGLDRFERMTIPVTIGGRGPYQFVVDTGADRTVLSNTVAEELGLPPGREVLVQGITGSELAPTVKAPSITLGSIIIKSLDLPVLPRERLGVDGLLGVDALQRRRLIMDFRERRLEILPDPGAFAPTGHPRDTYVPARDRFGRLVVIDATANGASIGAFVDSGAAFSIANRALGETIQARGGWRAPAPRTAIYGVTNHQATGEVRVLDTLRLGILRFTDVPMVVADLDLFERWGLGDKPALLLGSNVLRLFSRVEMDYNRKRMMFRVGADPQIWLA